jgi:small GTP-binding protein
MIHKKICLLGDFAVGKTSLVRWYVDRQFSDQYLSTIGVKISRKLLNYPTPEVPDRSVQMVMWDIEGSTEFKGIPSSYIEGAHGAIVVGDLTRNDTIRHAEAHIAQFLEANPAGVVVIAFNKADLASAQSPPHDLINGNSHVLASIKTSAKTGDGVDQLFDTLGRQFVNS